MSSKRIARMKDLLAALEPEAISIEDQSHLHVGHAGARDGRGHFALTIVSQRFSGLNMLQRHRLVYQTLGDMMLTDIHALTISAKEPSA